MKIGAALVLIAVGAILRFALITVVTHGVYLHTVGDILMAVGVLGLIVWLFVWAPWARSRSTTTRQYTSVEDGGYRQPPGTYTREERRYEDQYPS
jgi:amino acid permease